MTLQKKTLAVLGIAAFLLIIILTQIVSTILLENFENLEQQQVLNNLSRAQNALSAEIADLHSFNKDWAWWDDTYLFMEELNNDYIKSNIVSGTFVDQRLNVLLFVNRSGEIVAGNVFDLETEKVVEINNDLLNHLKPGRPLLEHGISKEGLSGIIMLQEDIVLISSLPILASNKEGSSRGSLIIGRYMNAQATDRLSKQIGIEISFKAQKVAAELNLPGKEFEKNTGPIIKSLNEEIIEGYAQILDIYNNPAVVLKIEEERSIYDQGVTAARFNHYAIIAVIILFTVLVMLLLRKVVLNPIGLLVKGIADIRQEGLTSTRLPNVGSDEIGDLAGSINKMLGTMEDSQKEREKLILELQKALDDVKALRGLLPICSSCKKIRDDKGSWNQMELYIAEHSEAKFSHGICPECSKKLYPEYQEDE